MTALDYIEGLYSGNVSRLESAVYPDLTRATPRDYIQTGRTALVNSTYSGLIELTRARQAALDDTARHIKISFIALDEDVAVVKVISANFTDYLQTAKIDGHWKIVNALYTSGSNTPPRLKNFSSEKEESAVLQTAVEYLNGIIGTDARRLEIALDPEFSKITLANNGAAGKTSFRRQRYDVMIENALARLGKLDEVYRDYDASLLDITDGLAVVRCELNSTREYALMFKSGSQWKMFASLTNGKSAFTLAQAMTVIAGNPMPDFTLPVYGGGQYSLSKYLGKNVLLMFPRGWVGNSWCAYCPYQYLELEQLETDSAIQEKNNLNIAFVLPYSSEKIKDWMDKFPEALQSIENNKHPQPPPAPGSVQADYSVWVQKNFPKTFDIKQDSKHTLIPVLADEHRTLSKQLKIFTHFWDGVSSEQNMSSVFIIDKKGILRFKYIGQMTEDRPSVEFLLNFIKDMK